MSKTKFLDEIKKAVKSDNLTDKFLLKYYKLGSNNVIKIIKEIKKKKKRRKINNDDFSVYYKNSVYNDDKNDNLNNYPNDNEESTKDEILQIEPTKDEILQIDTTKDETTDQQTDGTGTEAEQIEAPTTGKTEQVDIIEMLAEYYDYIYINSFTDAQLKSIEDYYNSNYNGDYVQFIEDLDNSYEVMYNEALKNNYEYEELSDSYKSYFLGEYLYALLRNNNDLSTLSDTDYYKSVVNSLETLSDNEDLTKKNDDYNVYGQQELLLEPETLDNQTLTLDENENLSIRVVDDP